MTSLASNTIPPAQTSTSPASTSNTPAHTASPSTSGQSSAAATAGSRPSYAQATKKPSYTPPIVSSTTGPSPPVVSGAQGTNARTSNASPVNGKTQVAPAVPTATPAMSGNVIVNGTSGSSNGHGRKPSMVSGGNGGAWVQNGNPQANRQQQGPIQFGSFPANQPGQPAPGGVPVSSPNLAAPTIPNPRVSSPQMSPSPLPQPAVSGGPLNQVRDQNITFGSLGSNVADRGDVLLPPLAITFNMYLHFVATPDAQPPDIDVDTSCTCFTGVRACENIIPSTTPRDVYGPWNSIQ